MQKIPFEDLPSTNTPVNASNLNTLQDNTENVINAVNNIKPRIYEISSPGTYRIVLGPYSPFIMYGIWNTAHFFGYFGMSGSSVVQKFIGTGPSITFTYVSNGAFDITLPSASDICIIATSNLSVVKRT